MKKLLSFLIVIVLVLAFGIAYADELQPGDGYSSDKMIRDDDIQKYNQDTDQSTVNQTPVLPDEIKGSAPGGGKDTDPGWKSDTYEKTAPVEKDQKRPSDSGEMGAPSRGWDPYRY
jgi:hypothetical protein